MPKFSMFYTSKSHAIMKLMQCMFGAGLYLLEVHSVWETKLADLRNRAAQEREGYEQENTAKLEEARSQWAVQLSQLQEANARSVHAAEAALQAARDEWQKVIVFRYCIMLEKAVKGNICALTVAVPSTHLK